MMLHPLRLRRLEKEMSQYHLSFLSGVPQVKISYAERGYPSLNEKQKEVIARTLGCTREEVFPSKIKRSAKTLKDSKEK